MNLLFKKYTVGEIFLSASVMDKRAMMALFFVMHASAGVVADAGAWPHIVHGPHYRFTGFQNLPDIVQ